MDEERRQLPGSYLVLELTNACQLRCRHCSHSEQGHPHCVSEGYFPLDGVLALLEDLRQSRLRFDCLILFWLGEPLLHPQFLEIYQLLLTGVGEGLPFGRLEVHTNGLGLNAAVAAGIVNRATAVQRWHFSLDAVKASTWERIKGRPGLEQVEENLERLLEFRVRGGFPWPQVVLQLIVSPQNHLEMDGFVARWGSRLARLGAPVRLVARHVPEDTRSSFIFFRALDCPDPASQAQANALYMAEMGRLGLLSAEQSLPTGEVALSTRPAVPCAGFWKSPVIGWDGRLTVCTRDSGFANGLGSVLETPFTRLWQEGPVLAWRQAVARGDYGDRPLCQGCFIPFSANYGGLSMAELAGLEEG